MKGILTFSFAYSLILFSFWKNDLIQFEFLEPTLLQFFSGMAIGEKGGINIFYFIAYYGLADLYIYLYNLSFEIPWYEIIYFLLSGIGIFFLFKSFYLHIQKNSLFVQLIYYIVLTNLFLLILFPIQYTKLSFILCFSGFSIITTSRANKKEFVISVFLYILGTMVRVEVGLLIGSFLGLFLLFAKPFDKFKFLYFLSICILLFSFSWNISKEIKFSNQYLKQLEPSLAYQLLDRENIIELEKLNEPVDKVKYVTFQNSISDPEHITISFLKSLVQENEYFGFDWDLLHRAIQIFYDSINQSFYLFLFYIFYLVLLSYTFEFRRLILFNLILLNITFLICYYIKMEIWLFQALIVSFILMNFQLFGHGLLSYLCKKHLYFLILILLNIQIFNNLIFRSNEYRHRLEKSQQFTAKMSNAFSNYILIPDISLFVNLMNNHKAFNRNSLSSCRYIYLDQDVLFWEEKYNSFLSKKHNIRTNNLKVFFQDISRRKDVLFLFRKEREILYINYFRSVLKSDLRFNKFQDFNWNGEIYRTLKISNESTFD